MSTHERIPTFKVRRLNATQVGFDCPKCGRLNRHGWPEGEDRSGHRASHCDCWPKGYYIEMEKEHTSTPIIPFPLPDDKIEKVIASTITDEEGKYSFKLKILEPGRYTLTARFEGNEKYAPVEASKIITVTPDVSTKESIKEYNKILRASIISSNNIIKIKECVEWSRTTLELCSKKLNKYALKEFEKTSKIAKKRIDELRTIEKEWGLNAQAGVKGLGFKVKKKTKKK